MSPWDGAGRFSRTDGTRTGATVWDQARQAGVNVNAADADAHDEDVAVGLENAVTRDGQNAPSGDLPMGGNKHTNVGAATAENEYVQYGQILGLLTPYVPPSGVTGTGNAIVLTPTAAITAYTAGNAFRFFAGAANTGPATIAVSGLAAVELRRANGSPLQAGDISVGQHMVVIYNGSRFLTDILPFGGVEQIAPWARANNPSGMAPPERLGSGVGNTKFLRRDGSWAIPFDPAGYENFSTFELLRIGSNAYNPVRVFFAITTEGRPNIRVDIERTTDAINVFNVLIPLSSGGFRRAIEINENSMTYSSFVIRQAGDAAGVCLLTMRNFNTQTVTFESTADSS